MLWLDISVKKGLVVAGYDKTPSDLTRKLEQEEIQLHYEENVDLIPSACKNPATTLVVYTPAIPETHKELAFFRKNGFEIEKRAQVLGRLNANAQRSLLRWNARKDEYIDHVCPHHAPKSLGL